MAVNPVQINTDKPSRKPYLEATGNIETPHYVKPLRPEGHLVHDRLHKMPKFLLKDLAYDMKAIREGYRGKANDHQAGRFNDTGLKIGGIGIAAMLAARTTNPMVRIMEYAGLGAFLFAMSAFPKIAIQAPSRALHGFDTGIEYIDDQGRKKSMFQDQNYIPFDMYRGDTPSTDLDVIGDRMGIPRDIQNRHGIIKEQMRKIAIQNNTLWMLTAGFATPIIAALTCCGLEKVIGVGLEKARNHNYNNQIKQILADTSNMNLEIDAISPNKLSQNVEKLLSKFKGQELPKTEYNKLINLLTENMDSTASEGVKQDIAKLFNMDKTSAKSFVIDDKSAEDLITTVKKNLTGQYKNSLEQVFVPSKLEINEAVKKVAPDANGVISKEQLPQLKIELKNLFANKMQKETTIPKATLEAYSNRIVESISKTIQKQPSSLVTEHNIKDVIDFAKVLGEFKSNDKILDSCKSFKFEYAPETVLARSYADFEKTLFKTLNICFKDLKQMKESDKFTQEILEKKIEALVKDDAKYDKAMKKLSKVISNMEIKLNGDSTEKSYIQDLFNAVENNYNNTAKRLNSINNEKFKNTIDKLVKEDVSTLSNSISSKQEMMDLLDGTLPNKFKDFNYWDSASTLENKIGYAKENAKGLGSSKNLELSRMIERYQGSKNSMNRILHTLDVFKREKPDSKYAQEILKKGKEMLLTADSSQFTMKNNTINNPEFYKDIMNTIWDGKLNEATKKNLENYNEVNKGNLLERFNKYITRFKDVIGNNSIDFTKPNHVLDAAALNKYTQASQTRMAKFNLVAQNPVDFAKKAAQRQYGNQKWLRIASTIGGTVLVGTVLAQLGFGKIKNAHNITNKQVSHDTNK